MYVHNVREPVYFWIVIDNPTLILVYFKKRAAIIGIVDRYRTPADLPRGCGRELAGRWTLRRAAHAPATTPAHIAIGVRRADALR